MNTETINSALRVVDRLITEECTALHRCEPKGLYEPIAYILELGGKRLRPLLAYLTYEHFSGADFDLLQIEPIVKAVELFHNFTLLHDDLMDDAPVRRGQPTVYKKWGANTAILSGDAMMIESYKALSQVDPSLLPRVLAIFNDMATGVCEGQQLDMEYESKDLDAITIADYLGMIRLKTSYLFRGSMMMGALVAGLDNVALNTIATAADRMGLAFQIMDDYLDVFSDKPDFGKVTGGDIVEGKRTWLLLKAYELDPANLTVALGSESTEKRIAEVTQVYISNHVDRLALAEVDRLTEEAIEMLDSLDNPPIMIKSLFRALVQRIS